MCDNPEHDHENFDPIELIRNTDDGQEVLAILTASVLALLADHAGKEFVSPPMAQLAEVVVAVAERVGNQDGIELAKFVKIAIDDAVASNWTLIEDGEDGQTWEHKNNEDDDLGKGA
jgi:hypothetical protein